MYYVKYTVIYTGEGRMRAKNNNVIFLLDLELLSLQRKQKASLNYGII